MRTGGEKGAALLIALLTTAILGAAAAALIYISTVETLIAGAYRNSLEASVAADAALDRALVDLDVMPDWSLALLPPPANAVSSFFGGATQFTAPDGRRFDLASLTADRQGESDRDYGPAVFGADSPQWRLFAHGALAATIPSGSVVQPVYLVVWVADDGSDGDGNPSVDANRRVLLHAEAFGSGGARTAIDAAVERHPAGWIRLRTWRAVP